MTSSRPSWNVANAAIAAVVGNRFEIASVVVATPWGRATVPAAAGAPLVREGAVIGALTVLRPGDPFSPTELEVIDLRTIAPFDEATVFASIAKTKRAVVLHEAVKAYGTGAEMSSRIHEELFDTLKAPVVRVGSSYSPVPFSPVLEKAWIYNQDQIKAAVRATIDRKARG